MDENHPYRKELRELTLDEFLSELDGFGDKPHLVRLPHSSHLYRKAYPLIKEAAARIRSLERI